MGRGDTIRPTRRRGSTTRTPTCRWTEQRNIQAVLDLMGSGRLDVGLLTTHRYPIEQAGDAYAMIEAGSEPALVSC